MWGGQFWPPPRFTRREAAKKPACSQNWLPHTIRNLFYQAGVYAGMFDQSILLDAPAGRKPVALFASFSAQIAAVGVLLLVPLLYHDVLPEVKLPMLLPLAFLPQAPPPVQTAAKSAPQSTRPSILHPVFRIPSTLAPLTPSTESVGAFIDAPPVGDIVGTPHGDVLPFLTQARVLPKPLGPEVIPAKPPSKPAAQLQVGGDVQAAKITNRVIPTYPLMARQSRIAGTVKLIGVIAKDGTVQKLQVVSGHPFLVQAALAAVRQWVYRPTLLNGEPVEVIAPIDVIFTLQ
jgi:protein TonB